MGSGEGMSAQALCITSASCGRSFQSHVILPQASTFQHRSQQMQKLVHGLGSHTCTEDQSQVPSSLGLGLESTVGPQALGPRRPF
jgi:hypothetical protein